MKLITVKADGNFTFLGQTFTCAIGRCGLTKDKREGDGATPIGEFPLRNVMYRADRVRKPVCNLPTQPIKYYDGWCDAPSDPSYNQMVQLPQKVSTERLWRNDNLYDIVVVIGYNDRPAIPGLGSAIFLHVATDNYAPTSGCIALKWNDLITILGNSCCNTRLKIM